MPQSATRAVPALRRTWTEDRQDREHVAHDLLVRMAAATDEEERRRLQDHVVRLYLDLARGLARRYRDRGIPLEDLEQTACTALVVAVQRFDARRGDAFLPFAMPTIQGVLRRHFRDAGWMVRPPRRVQELQARMSTAREALTHELRRPPRPSELAQHLDVDEDAVIEALAADGCFIPTSLDRPVRGTDGSDLQPLGSLLVDDDGALDDAEARIVVAPLLRRLTPRDRHIIALRYYAGLTQQEIGDRIGVSQIQVSRLLTRILRDLRRFAEEPPTPRTRAS
jgi:RNA polymerase sigma-B factor